MKSFYSSKPKEKQGRFKGRKDRVGIPFCHMVPSTTAQVWDCMILTATREILLMKQWVIKRDMRLFSLPLLVLTRHLRTPFWVAGGHKRRGSLFAHAQMILSPFPNTRLPNRRTEKGANPPSGIGNTPTGTGQVLRNHQERRILLLSSKRSHIAFSHSRATGNPPGSAGRTASNSRETIGSRTESLWSWKDTACCFTINYYHSQNKEACSFSSIRKSL